MIENLLVKDFFFPDIKISLDLRFDSFFHTTLKLYDAEISLFEQRESVDIQASNILETINQLEGIRFLKNFSDIEVVNNKISISNKHNEKFKYVLDLKNKKKKIFGLITEDDNELSFSIDKSSDFLAKVSANNFNIDLIQPFLKSNLITLNDLKISGLSEIQGNSLDKINTFNFDFLLDGKVALLTNFEKKEILLKKNSLKGFFNNDKIDISLNFNEKLSNIKIGLEKKNNENLKFYLDIDSIKVRDLLNIWPKNLAISTFDWMNANSSGTIRNVLIGVETEFDEKIFALRDVKGSFECQNVEIFYMEGMPSVKNINGHARVFKDKVVFQINSGNSNNLYLTNGEIQLFDLDTDFEKADISLDIKSNNSHVVEYLKLTTIDKKSYSKLEKIFGENILNLKLKFPLLVDLEVDQIEYSSDASILNGNLVDLYKNYSINSLDLNINVNMDKVDFNGEGKIDNSVLKFKGEQKIIQNTVTDKIYGKFFFEGSNLKEIFPKIIDSASGVIDIDFNIDNSEEMLKIEGIGNTDNFNSESKLLGPNLSFEGGKIRFLINPYDKKYSGFFDIQTKNIDMEINTVFFDSGLESIKINKLRSPNQDFKMSYNFKDWHFIVDGNKLALPHISFEEYSSPTDWPNIKLSINVNSLNINERKFYDSIVYFEKKNNEFVDLDIELKGEKDYHTIGIYEEFGNKKFMLESNYAPGLLEILDINIDLHTGSLRVEGEKLKGTNIYNGKVAGSDLVFLEAPLFADFISLFSLKGLAQKLKDGGIIFEDFKARYEFSNEKLRLVDSLIKGSELGLSFDTVVGFEEDYFLTTGTIIPAYTLNTLLTNFPIVGDIITAGSPEEGLLGANFKIEKNDGEYEMSYNPISVFVPNILKNFLAD